MTSPTEVQTFQDVINKRMRQETGKGGEEEEYEAAPIVFSTVCVRLCTLYFVTAGNRNVLVHH